jgi:hypothetical protein
MKIPNEGYYSKFNHVELGRYSSDQNRMFRENHPNGSKIWAWDEVSKYSAKNENVGIYHSIRLYDPLNGGIDGASLAPLHFDIDNKENPAASLEDARKILAFFLEDAKIPFNAINAYFSGFKGYHIEIECIPVRLNLVNENSAAIFRYLAEELTENLELKSLDYAVYDLRRMWRLAGSIHQKSGLYKIPCKEMILDGATHEQISVKAAIKPTEQELEIPEQQFSSTAAMFFAERVATFEAKMKEREQDKLQNFLSNGFSKSNIPEDSILKEFTPQRLREECPAVDELVIKAEKTGDLEHYERLFLCSLLTYTPESIEYFQGILSKLADYNFEISNLHIRDWIMRRDNGIGGRPYTCSKAAQVGIHCGGCDQLQPKTYGNSLGAERSADPSPVRLTYRYHTK